MVSDVAPRDLGHLAAAFRRCSWRRAAAGWVCSPRSTGCARCTPGSHRIWRQADIPLYAQHVDAMGNATLVDIFRAEEDSRLLGTDAMRDGVDVPGNALRLVVFERVPWPRPDILHRERRVHLSHGDPKGCDDRIVRLRLRQAFGRLIRRATDRGVFVLLDRRRAEPADVGVPGGCRGATRRAGPGGGGDAASGEGRVTVCAILPRGKLLIVPASLYFQAMKIPGHERSRFRTVLTVASASSVVSVGR